MAEETKEKSAAPKTANCTKCNKPLKRKTRYYRNGNYYCGKGCWKSAATKQSAKA